MSHDSGRFRNRRARSDRAGDLDRRSPCCSSARAVACRLAHPTAFPSFSTRSVDPWRDVVVIPACGRRLLLLSSEFRARLSRASRVALPADATNYIMPQGLSKAQVQQTIGRGTLGTDSAKGRLWQGISARQRHDRIGETARAMNFSLMATCAIPIPSCQSTGTDNFINVSSCGTATAVSVPCVFSALGRLNYSELRPKPAACSTFGPRRLPRVVEDNNTGCKARAIECTRRLVAARGGRAAVQLGGMLRRALARWAVGAHSLCGERHGDRAPQKGSHGPLLEALSEAVRKVGPVCTTTSLESVRRFHRCRLRHTILYTTTS